MTLKLHRSPAAGGGSYSDAVVIDNEGVRWIHVAGQTPRAARPDEVPRDLEAQAELCFAQIESILAVWAAGLKDVVQITVYLTSLEDYASFASVRARLFGDQPPASAAVGVSSLLDDALIEIAAIAVTRSAESR
jgi:enamine deaminase RidA (YjgF/YER057c/UK114 family)